MVKYQKNICEESTSYYSNNGTDWDLNRESHEPRDYILDFQFKTFSLAGNRTPAAAVKTPNPSH